MKVSLDDIKDISQCPAYFRFLKEGIRKPPSIPVQVIRSILQQGYVLTADTGFRMSWRSIIGHVDKEIFKDIEVVENEHIIAARKTTEYILSFLRRWYHEIYLIEEAIGFADINLERDVGRYTITSNLPLIKLSNNEPTIMIADDTVYTEGQLYNDIKIRGLLWLAAESIGYDTVAVQYMAIKQRGGMEMVSMKTNTSTHKRTKDVILQAAAMIEAGVDFPSVTRACEICSFRRRCRL